MPTASSTDATARFVVAQPGHYSPAEDQARALGKIGRLRFIALGTRRGATGVPPEQTRLNPRIGLAAYVAAKTLSPFQRGIVPLPASSVV